MDDKILEYLMVVWPHLSIVLQSFGTLVTFGYIYVTLTPTKEDDAWWEKLEKKPVIGHVLKFLVRFSPVVRKDKK